MADVPPFILTKPSLKLTPTTGTPPLTPVTLQCQGKGIQAVPDQDENEFETFCGTYTTYSPEKWTITFNAYSSFGTEGLWTLCRPLVGRVCDFVLTPNADVPISADNVGMTGKLIIKAFAFLDAEVTDASEVDVEMKVQGTPTFITTPPTTELASEPEPEMEPAA